MATPTSTPSMPNDASATAQTINFIEGLKVALASAQNTLNQKQAKLTNAQASKTTLSDQFLTAQTATAMAQNNLVEAEKAQEQINIITEFFNQRIAVTSQMVATATSTSTNMYEATEFIGKEGMDRVDSILKIVLAYNKTDTNTTTQWTHPFIQKVQVANAKAETALKAAIKATEESFKTLVSSLQIDFRTKNYYQQAVAYQKMMASLIERLTSEYVLLKVNEDRVDQLLHEAELNLALLNSEVQTASFTVAQLQAEFTAAQKGASYTGNTPAHAHTH